MTRTPTLRPILGLVMLALLIAAVVASVVFVGSERTGLPISGGMWPQSNAAEVAEAQERADAGDPAYTWQRDAEIANGNSPDAEIVARFIREELGWEAYKFNPFVGWDQADKNLTYVQCAPGQSNPIYPDDERAGQCAPTIDGFRYETVTIDLAQPERSDPTGIWVVARWAMTAPFAQSDPRVVEAEATARLEAFLKARVEGSGADGYVDVVAVAAARSDEVPLLYATSTGAPYERYELERVDGPAWPFGAMTFTVRLFAEGGRSLVEQEIAYDDGGFRLDPRRTTENGRPVPVDYAFFDGTVTLSGAAPWVLTLEQWGLSLGDNLSDESIEFVADPRPAVAGCEPGPLPADAATLAQGIRSDDDLEATAPMAVSVGGAPGLLIDVILAEGAGGCDAMAVVSSVSGARGGVPLERGSRLRLYLLDLPDWSTTPVMAIAIVAPEARFEDVIAAATPIIESTEFHAP